MIDMIDITTRKKAFKLRQIYFAKEPYEVRNCDVSMFYYASLPPIVHQYGIHEIRDYLEETGKCQCIDVRQPLEKVMAGFNYNTRSEIREAEKEGFDVRINKDYDQFIELFEKHAKSKGMKLQHLPKMQIEQQKHLLVSVWNKNHDLPIACDYAGIQNENLYMIFICNANCLGVVDSRLVSRASRLAHWETMKWAKAEGYEEVSVGALSDEGNNSNDAFKKGFGGYEKEITTFIKVYNPLLKLLWKWRS
jgi:hypothetical protein